MKSTFLSLLISCSCFIGSNSAYAEEASSPAMRLLEVIDFEGTSKQAANAAMTPMIEQIKAKGLPDKAIIEFKEAAERFFTKTFGDPAIKTEMAGIYEKHFTNKELEELLVFYQTPLGKKTLLTLPNVMKESMIIGQKFAAKNQQGFQQEIQDIMRKYQDNLQPPPTN